MPSLEGPVTGSTKKKQQDAKGYDIDEPNYMYIHVYTVKSVYNGPVVYKAFTLYIMVTE